MSERELTIDSLAAGGDGVGRDADGRVTFVPATVPGDRVRVRLIRETATFARGVLISVVEPSHDRVTPPCRYVALGCGGCAWQHVAAPAQLAAKQAIVEHALRKLALVVHPIARRAPDFGWRRRARFHVANGRVGLYRARSHDIIAIEQCAQLAPPLGDALFELAHTCPPDGELSLAAGVDGGVIVHCAARWPAAGALIGRAGIVGVVAGDAHHGVRSLEVDPGVVIAATGFAQASESGNAELIARVCEAIGPPVGERKLLELFAGAGNFTRPLSTLGWQVTPSDVVSPPHPPPGFESGRADQVVARRSITSQSWGAVVLDPPRSGAREAIAGIAGLAAPRVVYVSCDPATLARDGERLIAGGYRARAAWPLDIMPQTPHVEVVALFERG